MLYYTRQVAVLYRVPGVLYGGGRLLLSFHPYLPPKGQLQHALGMAGAPLQTSQGVDKMLIVSFSTS